MYSNIKWKELEYLISPDFVSMPSISVMSKSMAFSILWIVGGSS